MITGMVKKESDVYSFGMVLFEVFCGRLCTVKDNDDILLSGPLAREFYDKKRLEEIIDPSLKEHLNSDSLNKFSEIAYRCLHYDRMQRPPMDLVVKELEDLLKIQEEMIRLRDLGANTPTGVPYTEDQIMAMVRKGKQRRHILGVGRALAGHGRDAISINEARTPTPMLMR
ncbi:serine-threonine/tyrosine-protein kinase catalytic domain-containing protein [Tanacetum coccineum]